MEASMWANLAVQIPLVVAVIWFSMKMNENYQKSMDKRDEAYLKMISSIADKLNDHDGRLIQHMASVDYNGGDKYDTKRRD